MRKLSFVALAVIIVAGSLLLGACSTSSSREEFEGTWVREGEGLTLTVEIDTNELKYTASGTLNAAIVLEILAYDTTARTMYTRVTSVSGTDIHAVGEYKYVRYRIEDDECFYLTIAEDTYPSKATEGPYIREN